MESIAKIAAELHDSADQDLVVGIADANTGRTDDLFNVALSGLDLVQLRQTIGAGPSA